MSTQFPQETGYCFEDWGEIPYLEAYHRQQSYVDEIVQNKRRETIVFCYHPRVVTLGRGTRPGDVFSWVGETVDVNRGGRATYHGPSQVVLYPLVYLGESKTGFVEKRTGAKDLHAYMRSLELSMQELVKSYGISGARGQSVQKQVGDDEASEATGLWVGNQKMASIGIAVRKWVSFHGAALNIYHDPKAFVGMNPCGFLSETMVSLEELTGHKIDRSDIINKWSHILANSL